MKMRFILPVMFLIPLVVEGEESLEFHVTNRLQIPADDGQQGGATDGQFIYVQNSQQLFKYDLHGKMVMAGPERKLHHGGIVYAKGRVYAAVSGCDPNGTNQHYVHAYNARSLALIEKYDVGTHFTVCAGGITYRKGHFLVAESFFDDEHLDRIVEFDASFQHIKDYRIDFKSPYGIQGLEYLPGTDQFQIHSHGKVFYRINGRFESNSLIVGHANFELQGLARLDAKTLIVNHRRAQTLEFVELVRQPDIRNQR
ncbi:MAG: hypothetical protein MK103_14925 [Planctomycetes bacterium]|nr:hypothetical protein [Planctomycetota bacterium]